MKLGFLGRYIYIQAGNLTNIFQATSKSKDDINALGKVMLEASRKDAKGPKKNKEDSENLKAKEKEIREKLVLKLKKKAEGDINRAQIKVNRAKNDDFESVSDDDLSDEMEVSDEEMEEESEDDRKRDYSSEEDEKASEIDTDEELRLTSTDEDSDDGKHKKKRKKEKKDKKKRSREREREKDKSSRKQREIDRQIRIAERVATKRSPVRRSPEYKADLWEHEKYDRERNPGRGERERTPTGYYGAKDYYNNRRRSVEREEREAGGPMDEFQRDEFERERFLKAGKMKKVERFLRQQGMRKEQIEREMEKAYEQYFSTLSKKEAAGGRQIYSGPRNAEQEKEEQWERMTNPHLFGGGKNAFRKSKADGHYEQIQKETLENEIRIRERREKPDYNDRGYRGDYRDRDRDRYERDYRDSYRDNYRDGTDRYRERRRAYSRERY